MPIGAQALEGAPTNRYKLQWQKDNLTGQATSYTYDTVGRLTQAAESGGTAPNTYAYSYDTRGNRLTATVTGGIPSSQTFTANAANQISATGYTYDGAGNLTADPSYAYSYTGAEQMKTVTKGTNTYSYKYAGADQNEVLQQQNGSTTYQLVYGRTNQQGLPVIEQAKVGANTAYIENDPVTGQPLMLRSSAGVQTLYVYTGQGTPSAHITDYGGIAFAQKFDPYGTATLTAGGGGNGYAQNPFGFSGGIQDRATGWVKLGARSYNPTTGRWTQQDTLDTPLDPANANRYAYAGGDPVNLIDALGTLAEAQICNLVILGVGLVVGSLIAAATAGLAVGVVAGAATAEAIGVGAGLTSEIGFGLFGTFVC